MTLLHSTSDVTDRDNDTPEHTEMQRYKVNMYHRSHVSPKCNQCACLSLQG